MRTTLNIDAPALAVVRSLATQRGTSMGRIVSDLVMESLRSDQELEERSGFPVFPRVASAAPATMELVNRLRDGDAP
jgi:hypothetical protein